MQIHRDGDDVAVFTRTLDDVTAHVPEAVEAALALPARTAVLDGEVIALREDGRPHPFQVTGSRFGARRDLERLRREIPLSVFFFDLLHLDGEDLLDAPLSERAAALDALAPDRRIPHTVAEDAGAAQAELDAALAAGHEGVMVKALEAPYAAGPARRRVAEGQARAHARPRRARRRVGPRAPPRLPLQPAPRRPRRRRLGDARQDVQGAHRRAAGLADRALPSSSRPTATATSCSCAPSRSSRSPSTAIQTSRRYPAGMALRFARVKRYRDDKPAAEADTVETVRAIAGRGDG